MAVFIMQKPAELTPDHTSPPCDGEFTRPMNEYMLPWNHSILLFSSPVSRCLSITGRPSARTPPEMITEVQQKALNEMNMNAAAAMNILEKCPILIFFSLKLSIQSKMMVSHLGGDSSSLGAHDEAFLYKERLIDLLERALVLTDSGGYCIGSDRAALESGDYRAKDLVINRVQSPLVDLQLVKGVTGYVKIYMPVPHHLGEVTDTLEESVGDSWRSTASQSDLLGSLVVDRHVQDPSATAHDPYQIRSVVIFKGTVDSESFAQRRGEQSASSRGTDKSERIE